MGIGAFNPTPYGKHEERFAFHNFTVSTPDALDAASTFVVEALQGTGFQKSSLIEIEFDPHSDQEAFTIKGSPKLIAYLQNAAEIPGIPEASTKELMLSPRQAKEFLNSAVDQLEVYLVQTLLQNGYEPWFAEDEYTNMTHIAHPDFNAEHVRTYLSELLAVEREASLARSFAHAINDPNERFTYLYTGMTMEPPETRHFSYAAPVLVDDQIYLMPFSTHTATVNDDEANALYSIERESEAYQAIRSQAIEGAQGAGICFLPDELA